MLEWLFLAFPENLCGKIVLKGENCMTRLTDRKTRLVVTTGGEIKERGKCRAVVLELKPLVMLVRLLGTRRVLPISYEDVYQTAAKREADRRRAERRAGRAG